MNTSVLTKIRLMFLVVLLLGAGLSFYVYTNGRALIGISEPLMTKQLPTLQVISRLQLAIAALEPTLYEYYASVDREAYLKRYESNQNAIQEDMDRLAREFVSASRMLTIRSAVSEISDLANDLDATLSVYGSDEEVDWDRARELLAQVSETGRQVKDRLNVEAASVHRAVSKGGVKTNESVNGMVTAVLVFSGVIGFMAAFIGFYVIGQIRRSEAAAA
jgi:CHASE3 domain sensor protein